MIMNWKIVGVIIATAVATAAVVVYLMQQQNKSRKRPFEYDDLFDDDFELVENIDLPDDIDEGEPVAETEEEAAEAVEEAAEAEDTETEE